MRYCFQSSRVHRNREGWSYGPHMHSLWCTSIHIKSAIVQQYTAHTHHTHKTYPFPDGTDPYKTIILEDFFDVLKSGEWKSARICTFRLRFIQAHAIAQHTHITTHRIRAHPNQHIHTHSRSCNYDEYKRAKSTLCMCVYASCTEFSGRVCIIPTVYTRG